MRSVLHALVVSAAVAATALAQPLTTAFTYQGELASSNSPADGVYDFQFALYDSAAGTTQVGPTLCSDNLTIVNGRFTVQLDFGAVFAGQQRYLEVRVRPDTGLSCASTAGLTTLAPRTSLTAAPSAAFALTAASAASATTATSATNATQLNGQPPTFYTNAANLTGLLSDARLSSNVANLNANQIFTASKSFTAPPSFGVANGTAPFLVTSSTRVTNLNADLLDGLDSSAFSQTSHTHDHGTLTGLADDDHPQYFNQTRGDLRYALTSHTHPLAGDLTGPLGANSIASLQGRALSAATPSANQVLTYTGSQWVPQTLPSYTAGAGLSLSGTTFSVPSNGITTAMLATDPASLTKVSGSMTAVSGSNIGINIAAPETDLHIRSPAPAITVEGNINAANAASLLLLEDLGSSTDTGGRITYDGAADDLLIGTVVSDAVTTAITIPRGSPNVTFAGTITVPTTTRTLSLSGADFICNEFAHLSPNASGFPRINELGASGTVAHAVAPIHLPEDAVITQFKIFVAGGGTNPITATLRRTPLSSQTTTAMATLTTAGLSTYSTTTIASPTIDNDANAYFVQFTWTNNGVHSLDVNGAQITYTITSPLP